MLGISLHLLCSCSRKRYACKKEDREAKKLLCPFLFVFNFSFCFIAGALSGLFAHFFPVNLAVGKGM